MISLISTSFTHTFLGRTRVRRCRRGRSGDCSSGRFYGAVADSARVAKYRVGREGVAAAAGACHVGDMGAVRGQAQCANTVSTCFCSGG